MFSVFVTYKLKLYEVEAVMMTLIMMKTRRNAVQQRQAKNLRLFGRRRSGKQLELAEEDLSYQVWSEVAKWPVTRFVVCKLLKRIYDKNLSSQDERDGLEMSFCISEPKGYP